MPRCLSLRFWELVPPPSFLIFFLENSLKNTHDRGHDIQMSHRSIFTIPFSSLETFRCISHLSIFVFLHLSHLYYLDRTPPPPVRRHHQIVASGRDCGERQTERSACALFTEREVSFRVEASARTMTKESS
jgi:hypothetical protein